MKFTRLCDLNKNKILNRQTLKLTQNPVLKVLKLYQSTQAKINPLNRRKHIQKRKRQKYNKKILPKS